LADRGKGRRGEKGEKEIVKFQFLMSPENAEYAGRISLYL
jgi:hypothetical protein